jgi:hypothetical protein
VAKSFLDRTALALFRTVPFRAAHHLLFLAQSHPELSDRWGYHIRPIHYYEPIPDFRAITAEQINRRRSYPAIDFRWEDQLALLDELAIYANELTAIEFDFDNSYFGGFDAATYYSLVRHLKPQRVIEIGGGYSTRIAHQALARNKKGNLTCIEPYPEERLAGSNLSIELIRKRVEEIDVDFFTVSKPTTFFLLTQVIQLSSVVMSATNSSKCCRALTQGFGYTCTISFFRMTTPRSGYWIDASLSMSSICLKRFWPSTKPSRYS